MKGKRMKSYKGHENNKHVYYIAYEGEKVGDMFPVGDKDVYTENDIDELNNDILENLHRRSNFKIRDLYDVDDAKRFLEYIEKHETQIEVYESPITEAEFNENESLAEEYNSFSEFLFESDDVGYGKSNDRIHGYEFLKEIAEATIKSDY